MVRKFIVILILVVATVGPAGAQAPAAPVANAATNIGSTSFTASWSSVSGASFYYLDVSLYSNFSSFITNYNGTTVSGTSKSVTGLNLGTTYYYRVRAFSTTYGSSPNSNVITVQTSATPPAPVSLPASFVNSSSFQANWGAVSGATYRLDVSTSSSFSGYLSGYNNLTVTSTSQVIYGLSPNTTYWYRIRAVASSLTSANSTTVSQTTTPVAPVANVATAITATSFTASWNAVSGATGYRLDVATDAGFINLVSGFNNMTTSATSYSVTGLTVKASYFYRVRAVGAGGVSSNSNVVLGMESDQNYIRSIDVNQAGLTTLVQVENLGINSRSTKYDYVDGLGRPVQTVMMQGSFAQKDIVQPVFYDDYGRENIKYLPYVSSESSGGYKANPVGYSTSPQSLYYSNGIADRVEDDSKPYAETRFEDSPRNRIVKQGASGTVWQPSVAENSYTNVTKSYAWQDFVSVPSGGGGSVSLQIQNNTLTVSFSAGFTSSTLRTGYVKFLGTTPKLYDMTLGTIANGSYKAHIRKGYFYIESMYETPIPVTSFGTSNFTVNLVQAAVNDRSIKMSYEFNGTGEVLLCKYNALTNLVDAGTAAAPVYYAANTLYVTKAIDEHNNWVLEYKDKNGRVILKRVQVGATQSPVNDVNFASTYYVYDDFGNLSVVLPPEAVNQLATGYYQSGATDATKDAFLKRWCFRYSYDGRRRMTQKQVPGAEPVYMVYDNRNRLVLTQDGNQRAGATNAIKYWTFTKYDELNRPIATGIKDTATTVQLTQAEMQGVVDLYYAMFSPKPWRKYGEKFVGAAAAGNIHGYTNNSYPQVTTGTTLDPNSYLTVTYYDNYTFRNDWLGTYTYLTDGLSATVNSVTYTQPATGSENTRVVGQVTGTKTKVLDGGVTGGYTWLKSINFYDDKYRVIQTQSDNYKGGVDQVSNLYDFVGKVLKTKITHTERDVAWKDIVSVKQEGNKLIAGPSGPAQWGFGAASVQVLPAGVDGWFEVTVTETNTSKLIGFNDSNSGGTSNSDMNYAFQLYNSTLYIQENTANKATVTGLVPGDVLRMERVGSTISFKRNGTPITTSAITPYTGALFIDNTFHLPGNTLAGIKASFATTSKSITRTFDYDHAGRLLRTWHKIDNGTDYLLAHNTYNELGQLVDKKLHSTVADGSNNKQSIDYRYNIRGWLTSMNNAALTSDAGATNDDATDYFGMNLSYNTVDTDLSNTGLYNGNISAMKWSNYSGTASQKGYTYSYDPMNRITGSAYKEKTTSWAAAANNGFAETGYQYDLNGNITRMQRNDKRGTGWMDNMTYNYGTGTTQSNKLLYVSDAGDATKGFVDGNLGTATDYTYDANGNMTRDLNKGIGTSTADATNLITYNYLNLPETVTKGGNTMRYIYDATGRKLSQVVTFGTTQKQTDYVGEFTYENDVLQYISHEEGRIVTSSNQVIYTNDFDVLSTDITTIGATTSAYTNTSSGEKYVKVTSSSTTAGNGILPIGGTFTVAAGDRYRIRAKGYRTTNAVNLQVKAGSTVLGNTTLPNNATNEGWVEQIVTIPAGSTTMQAGLVWGTTVTSGEIFYLNDFEITKLTTSAPEYQYNLKDHLGNVRVTFTTQTTTNTFTAGFETANQSTEATKFNNYPSGGMINTQSVNATTGTNSELLNGGYSGQVGLAKSFSVMPGDVVSIQAVAKYSTPTSTPTNYSGFVTSLLSAFSLAAPVAGETGTAAYGVNTFGNWEIGTTGNSSKTDPVKVFVTIILFDRNYNFIDVAYQASGGSGVMMSKSYTVKEPGYAYLYISNEHPTQVNAYFDDVSMSHTPSAVVQMDDYYPFGLTFNSLLRENSVKHNYLYNSKELQDELNLGWLDYGLRMYDPTTARWTTLDPLSEIFRRWTPYSYAIDNPIRFIDPDGMAVYDIGIGTVYTQEHAVAMFKQLQGRYGETAQSINPQGYHQVQKGETWEGLAKANGVSVADINHWNSNNQEEIDGWYNKTGPKVGSRVIVSSAGFNDHKVRTVAQKISKETGLAPDDPVALEVIRQRFGWGSNAYYDNDLMQKPSDLGGGDTEILATIAEGAATHAAGKQMAKSVTNNIMLKGLKFCVGVASTASTTMIMGVLDPSQLGDGTFIGETRKQNQHIIEKVNKALDKL